MQAGTVVPNLDDFINRVKSSLTVYIPDVKSSINISETTKKKDQAAQILTIAEQREIKNNTTGTTLNMRQPISVDKDVSGADVFSTNMNISAVNRNTVNITPDVTMATRNSISSPSTYNENITIQIMQHINNYHTKLIYSHVSSFILSKEQTILDLKTTYINKRFNMPTLKIHEDIYKNINIEINGYDNNAKKFMTIPSHKFNNTTLLKTLNANAINVSFINNNNKLLMGINKVDNIFLFDSMANLSIVFEFIKLHAKIKLEKLTYNTLPIILTGSLITLFNIDIKNSMTNFILLDQLDENIVTSIAPLTNNMISYIYLIKKGTGVTINKCTKDPYELISYFCKNELILCSFGIICDKINEIELEVINKFKQKYILDGNIYEGNIKEMITICMECVIDASTN